MKVMFSSEVISMVSAMASVVPFTSSLQVRMDVRVR
jgi:hypothetical protein